MVKKSGNGVLPPSNCPRVGLPYEFKTNNVRVIDSAPWAPWPSTCSPHPPTPLPNARPHSQSHDATTPPSPTLVPTLSPWLLQSPRHALASLDPVPN
jgi:hypothetical protein